MSDRIDTVKAFYRAFAEADRGFVEDLLAPDFSFSSPPDPLLDRQGFFDRCWPGAGRGRRFDFTRLVESGNEVIVTYDVTNPDGSIGCNTEVMTFNGEKLRRTEVYFGWTIK